MWGLITVVVAVVVCACGSSPQAESTSTEQSTSVNISAQALAGRGEVVATESGLDAWTSHVPWGTRISRIVYRSTSGVDGTPTTVSGAVFVPAGQRPAGGWPLIAYAHGTTGITRDCAPSDRADMFGDLTAVNAFLTSGYAVVTTDYQGLGMRTDAPAHPYLEPATAAYNVIDAVRAARAIEPTIGMSWLVSGASQGGNAAWATAEYAPTYGSGAGTLVGAVAMVPLLDATYLTDRAQSGELTPSQRWLYPILVKGVAQGDPQIAPAQHLRGIVADQISVLTSCSGDKSALAAKVNSAETSVFTSSSAQAAQRLDARLAQLALPRTRTEVPILAIYGSVDEIIPVDVMEVSLGRGCAEGDSVYRVRREGQGHSLNPGALLGSWISDRFAGKTAAGNC